jgi:hypothetical protein
MHPVQSITRREHAFVWTGAISSNTGYPVTTTRKADSKVNGSVVVHLLKLRAEGKELPKPGVSHYSHTCHNKRCLRHYVIESVIANRKRIYCPKSAECPCTTCDPKETISACAILHPDSVPCLYPASHWANETYFLKDEIGVYSVSSKTEDLLLHSKLGAPLQSHFLFQTGRKGSSQSSQ